MTDLAKMVFDLGYSLNKAYAAQLSAPASTECPKPNDAPQTLVDRVCEVVDNTSKFGQRTYERDANRLFPQGCTCVDDSGDCDWCAVYYDGPEEFERSDEEAKEWLPGGNMNHSLRGEDNGTQFQQPTRAGRAPASGLSTRYAPDFRSREIAGRWAGLAFPARRPRFHSLYYY
ncbi:MAG: hypothetical protein ACLQEI_06825 [Terriglobales bacterium]